jgi:hypothetical protein
LKVKKEDACLNTSNSSYYGNRWQTVEQHCLVNWIGDDAYRWGAELRTQLLPGCQVSLYLSVRADRGMEQNGAERSFLTWSCHLQVMNISGGTRARSGAISGRRLLSPKSRPFQKKA